MQILRTCGIVSRLEWSGPLFVKVKGEPNNPTSIVVDVIGFHIMDVGTAGHTAFEYDESVIDVYEAHPEYMECRLGLVHSHNTMTTFFSGEDMEELEDNTANTDFYVSLIVNNASKYTAKIAWRTDEQVEIETTGWYKKEAIKFNEKRTNSSLYTVDLDIEIEGIEDLTAIDARLMEIEAQQKLKAEAREIARKADIAKNTSHAPKYQPKGKGFPTFNGEQMNAFPKGDKDKTLGFEDLREIQTLDDEILSEEMPPMEGETFDNLLGCLMVLNLQYDGGMIRAMQEVKDKVTSENFPMLVDMINDNIEDYYEQHYGELCHMEAYMQICTSFIRELRKFSVDAFPIVEPMIDMLSVEIGEQPEFL